MGITPAMAEFVVDRGIAQQEQMEERNVTISVEGKTLHIAGAAGQTLEVVSLTGRRITTVKIESPSQKVELNLPKGCYILKVGTVVRKVSLC